MGEVEKVVASSTGTGFRPKVSSPEDQIFEALTKARQHIVTKETSYVIGIAPDRDAFLKNLKIVIDTIKLKNITGVKFEDIKADEEWLKTAHEFDRPSAAQGTTLLLTQIGSAKTVKDLKLPFEVKSGVRVSTSSGEFITDKLQTVSDPMISLWELYKKGPAPRVNHKFLVMVETQHGKKCFTVIEKEEV